jgi:hypothetical protein
MIVYRQQRGRVVPSALLQHVSSQIEQLRHHVSPPRDAIVTALIDAGELASAVADVCAPHRDAASERDDALLALVVSLAGAAEAAWRETDAVTCHLNRARDLGVACGRLELPPTAERSVSEGFAYYAVGPELYAEAARRWADLVRPTFTWCIGLRTIGLTLAAAVAAALAASGSEAHAVSVRPRGHPFERRLELDRGLVRRLLSRSDAWWLIIDEGPGISGSSIAGAAERLVNVGVPEERVVLMPAYEPNVNGFADHVRARWTRHRVHHADFDSTWTESGRLAREFSAASMEDIGAGAWRSHVLGGREHEWPACNPQHERRKYVLTRGTERAFLKFAGHGRYGDRVERHAEAAAAASWSPRPVSRRQGWIEFGWRHEPFGARARTANELSQLVQYVAFVRRTRTTGEDTDPTALVEMATSNARETCGDEAAAALEATIPLDAAPAVYVDGHLRPHEWYVAAGRFQKIDNGEHGDDHFFPGPTDIAWDLGALIEEWSLEPSATRYVLEQYIRCTRDYGMQTRLPFYRGAYLAFRAGYTAFGREQVADPHDRQRFGREHEYYAGRLRALLGATM